MEILFVIPIIAVWYYFRQKKKREIKKQFMRNFIEYMAQTAVKLSYDTESNTYLCYNLNDESFIYQSKELSDMLKYINDNVITAVLVIDKEIKDVVTAYYDDQKQFYDIYQDPIQEQKQTHQS